MTEFQKQIMTVIVRILGFSKGLSERLFLLKKEGEGLKGCGKNILSIGMDTLGKDFQSLALEATDYKLVGAFTERTK